MRRVGTFSIILYLVGGYAQEMVIRYEEDAIYQLRGRILCGGTFHATGTVIRLVRHRLS